MKIVDNQSKYNSISISKYKKSDLLRELETEIINGNYNKALYFGSEMFTSGYFKDLWEFFFIFISEYIHLLNPNLYFSFFKKYELYNSLEKKIKKKVKLNLLDIRNHYTLQNDLLVILKNLCLSPKKHISYFIPSSYNNQSLNSVETRLHSLSRNDYNTINEVINNRDNKDILLAIKEFNYHFNQLVRAKINNREQNSNDIDKAFYWLGRVFLYGCEQNYVIGYPYQISLYSTNDKKINNNFTNMIWNLILNAAKIENNFLNNIISIYSIFETTLLNKSNKKNFLVLHSVLYFIYKNGDFDNRYQINKGDRDLLRTYYKSIQDSITNNKPRDDYIEINEEKIIKEKKKVIKKEKEVIKKEKEVIKKEKEVIKKKKQLEKEKKETEIGNKLKSYNLMNIPSLPGKPPIEYNEKLDEIIIPKSKLPEIVKIVTKKDKKRQEDKEAKKEEKFSIFLDSLFEIDGTLTENDIKIKKSCCEVIEEQDVSKNVNLIVRVKRQKKLVINKI